MTTEQKNRIASLRSAGQGYTAIARELGLSKSAISNGLTSLPPRFIRPRRRFGSAPHDVNDVLWLCGRVCNKIMKLCSNR